MIPKRCASSPIVPRQCHQFPESRFSLLFTPLSPEPLRGRVETACAHRGLWRGGRALSLRRVPVAAYGLRWREPRSAPGRRRARATLCHAADRADPPAPSLRYKSWTVAAPGGYLDIWPLPFTGALPLPSLPGCKAPARSSVHSQPSAWAFLSSLPSPVPQLPPGTRGTGCLRGPGRVGQRAALGFSRAGRGGSGCCPSPPPRGAAGGYGLGGKEPKMHLEAQRSGWGRGGVLCWVRGCSVGVAGCEGEACPTETLSRVLPAGSWLGRPLQEMWGGGSLQSRSPRRRHGYLCGPVVPVHWLSCWGLPYLLPLYFLFFFSL